MLEQFLTIIGITTLVMLSPGPDLVIVTRNTLLGGRSAGVRTAVGVLAGNLVHISYCVVGIGLLISKSVVAFNILKYAGAAYLIYLGLMSLRADSTALYAPTATDAPPSRAFFAQGLVNNLLNPKGTLFYLGVFTVVITPDTSTSVTLLLVPTMMAISAGFWLLFVLTLDTPIVRRAIRTGNRAINRTFGVLLCALGARVALIDR